MGFSVRLRDCCAMYRSAKNSEEAEKKKKEREEKYRQWNSINVWDRGRVQREWETVWRGKYPQLLAGGGRINNKENLSLAAMGESKSKKKKRRNRGKDPAECLSREEKQEAQGEINMLFLVSLCRASPHLFSAVWVWAGAKEKRWRGCPWCADGGWSGEICVTVWWASEPADK